MLYVLVLYLSGRRVVGLLRPRAAKPSIKMPPVGSKIQLIPKDTRNTYKAGTTKKQALSELPTTHSSIQLGVTTLFMAVGY